MKLTKAVFFQANTSHLFLQIQNTSFESKNVIHIFSFLFKIIAIT